MAYDFGFDDDSEVLEKLEKKFGGDDAEPGVKPVEKPAEEAGAEGTEEEPGEAAGETTAAAEEHFAEDDHLVSIGEGEAARKVSVKDLRDLAIREDAIKARDTETEMALKRATDEGDKALSLIQSVLTEAQKEFGAFAELDKPGGWATARQKLNDEGFAQLQRDYMTARNRVLFLQQEGNAHVAKIRENRTAQLNEALKARDAALGKLEGITGGWDKAKSEVSAYVKTQGLPADVLDTITNPAAVHMIYKAMMFDRGAAKAATTVKPVATSASKTTIKPGSKPSKDAATDKVKAAQARLKESGSVDDAAALFEARFG